MARGAGAWPVGIWLAAVAVSPWLATACAPRQTNRWVTTPDGKPLVMAVSPPAGRSTPHSTVSAEARAKAIAAAERTRTPGLPSAESVDPGLRAALAALAANPTASARIGVAREYHRLRVYDAAITHYNDALKSDGRNADAFDGRARVWRDAGLLGLALADAARAEYFAPNSAIPRNTKGTILEALGQPDAARGAYEDALKVEPDATYARANLQAVLARATKTPTQEFQKP